MSHIVEAKTSIKNPDMTLLRQTVELVARQQVGGTVEEYYYDFSRKIQYPVQLALFSQELIRGIGLVIDKKTGELIFKGDPWERKELFAAIQQQIIQTYVSLATLQALQQMGYEATAEDGEAGQIVLTGVNLYA